MSYQIRSYFKYSLLYAAVASSSISAMADTNRLEEMVVSASRTEMPLRTIGASMSVFTEQDIAAFGHTSVADVLRFLPAIGVSNSGGLGKTTSLRIRGEEGYRTKLLIDGVDISDPTGTQVLPQIQHLVSSQLERIEVLRGPQGMMYGADAGGIINLITKKGEEGVQGNLSAETGRYNSEQLAGNIRGKVNQLDYSLTFSDLSSDGFNARPSDTTKDDDGYDNTTLGLALGYQFTETFRLQAVIRDVDADTNFDNCFGASGSTNNCESEFDQSNYKVDALYNTDKLEHKFSYALADTERGSFADSMSTFATEGELEQIQYFGTLKATDNLQLVYGVDWQEESIDSSSKAERDQTGIYVELQGDVNDAFFFTAGVRNDDNDDFGTYTSYRLTSAYIMELANKDVLKLKASWGTGFRAPSLSEIAYNNGAAAFPPASLTTLEEETSAGYDLGVEFHGSNGVFVEAVYFCQDIEDALYFDLAGFSGYLQDSGTTESTGVELSAEYPVTDNLLLLGNYTYNDTEDADGLQRIRRPEDILNLGIRFTSDNQRLKLNANWRQVENAQDEVYDPAIFASVRVNLDDYQVLDVNASYAISDGFEVYARGENVLDEEYEEVTGYNTARAAVYGGVRFQF